MCKISAKTRLCRSQIMNWIEDGRFTAGQKLPAEQELAKQLGVNHRTVRRALSQLVDEGVVIKQPRVGNFVSEGCHDCFDTDIAVILPKYLAYVDSHAAIGLVLRGVHEIFDPHRFNIHTLVYERGRLWEDAGRIAVRKRVTGALVTPYDDVDESEMRPFCDAGIAAVLMDPPSTLTGGSFDWVSQGASAAVHDILKRLYELGHRRLAIAHFERSNYRSARVEVVERFYKQHNLGNPKDALIGMPYEFDGSDSCINIDTLTARLVSDTPPTAVIVPDEMVASELFRFCLIHGIQVPEDLSIAAFMDFAPTIHAIPPTAPDSINTQIQVAATAAKRLAHTINRHKTGKDEPAQGIVLNSTVQWTRSIGVAPDLTLAASK